jgi:hypothetical protein
MLWDRFNPVSAAGTSRSTTMGLGRRRVVRPCFLVILQLSRVVALLEGGCDEDLAADVAWSWDSLTDGQWQAEDTTSSRRIGSHRRTPVRGCAIASGILDSVCARA